MGGEADRVWHGTVTRKLRVEYPGAVEERKETAESQAEAIVTEELKRRRWREKNSGRRAKAEGDWGKVALAARLRAETVMTVN